MGANAPWRIAPPAKPTAPPVTRRKRAENLIAKLAAQDAPGQGTRKGNWGHDILADMVVAFDLPLALSLIRGQSGTPDPAPLG